MATPRENRPSHPNRYTRPWHPDTRPPNVGIWASGLSVQSAVSLTAPERAMPPDTTLPASPPRRRVRRLWLPALCILVPVVFRVLAYAATKYDFGENAVFTLASAYMGTLTLGLLGLAVWFFFLSGLAPRVRLGTALVLVLAGAGLYAATDRVEFDGQMNPLFYWA